MITDMFAMIIFPLWWSGNKAASSTSIYLPSMHPGGFQWQISSIHAECVRSGVKYHEYRTVRKKIENQTYLSY